MKNIITLTICTLLAGLLWTACNNLYRQPTDVPETTELTTNEKEVAKKEIADRVQEIIEGCKKLDIEAALKPYSTDLTIVNSDGSINNYQEMKSIQAEFFKTAASINYLTAKEDFSFLANDLVMCTWSGTNEYALKTGERYKIAPHTGSMLFNKAGNEWKIIYVHESSGTAKKIEN